MQSSFQPRRSRRPSDSGSPTLSLLGLLVAGLGLVCLVMAGFQVARKPAGIGFGDALLGLLPTIFVTLGAGFSLVRIFARASAGCAPFRTAAVLAVLLAVCAGFWSVMMFRTPAAAFASPFVRHVALYACWLPPVVAAAFAGGFHLAPDSTRAFGAWVLIFLFGLVFFGLGGGFAARQIGAFAEARAIAAWSVVPGHVLRTSLERHHVSRSRRSGTYTTFEATATYSYAFAGKTYTSSRVGLVDGADDAGSWQANRYAILRAHLQSGAPIDVRVDPARPASAILFPEVRPELFGSGSLVFFGFGIFGAVVLLAMSLPVPRRYRGFRTSPRGTVYDDPPEQQGFYRNRLLLPVAAGLFSVLGLVMSAQTRMLPPLALPPDLRNGLALWPLAPLVVLGIVLVWLAAAGRWISVRREGNEIVITGLPPGKSPKFNGATAPELPSTGAARRFRATNDNLTVFVPARDRRPALTWRGV